MLMANQPSRDLQNDLKCLLFIKASSEGATFKFSASAIQAVIFGPAYY
jgi:hypothetical protein